MLTSSSICEKYLNGEFAVEPWTYRKTLELMYLQLLAYVFSYLFRCRYGFKMEPEHAQLAP